MRSLTRFVPRWMFSLAAGLLVGGLGMAILQGRLRRPAPVGGVADVEPDRLPESLLGRKVAEFAVEGESIQATADRLSSLIAFPVSITTTQYLQDANGKPARLTLKLRNTTVEDVVEHLTSLLRSYQHPFLVEEWDWELAADGIFIGPAHSLPRTWVQRVYRVGPLRERYPSSTQPVAASVCFPGLGYVTANDLEALVSAGIATDSWNETGSGASVHAFGDELIVRQTLRRQWSVRRLLEQMLSPTMLSPAASEPAVMPSVWNTTLQKWIEQDSRLGDQTLLAVLPEVSVENTSAEEAVAAIARAGEADVVCNPSVKTLSGRVSGSFSHMPLWVALKAVSRQLGGDGDDDALSFWVEGGLVVVGRADDPRAVFSRVYPIADLVSTGPNGAKNGPARSDASVICALIQGSVAPDAWRGAVGTITDVNGRLAVRQTWENHLAIARLLEAIRRTGELPESAEPADDVAGESAKP